MIRLTKKLLFAIEAVLDIAYNGGVAPVRSVEITEREGIPRRYLEPVLQELVREKILIGIRGPSGGYRLARLPAAISVAEVVAAIDGDIGMTQCSVHAEDCERTNYCPTRPHWAAINRAVGAALSAISLAEMIGPLAFAPAFPVFAEPATRAARILMEEPPR